MMPVPSMPGVVNAVRSKCVQFQVKILQKEIPLIGYTPYRPRIHIMSENRYISFMSENRYISFMSENRYISFNIINSYYVRK